MKKSSVRLLLTLMRFNRRYLCIMPPDKSGTAFSKNLFRRCPLSFFVI